MKKSSKKEFSKVLLIQESVLVWIVSIAFIILAYICIMNGFEGSLPWLSAMASFPWAAYGVSQACYYQKSKAENTKNGIKYESVMSEITSSYVPPSNENDNYGIIEEINSKKPTI